MSIPPDWTVNHFSQANPKGPAQGNVAVLLRRIATTIDELGEVEIQDLTFHEEITSEGSWWSATVYYQRAHKEPDA